MVDILTHTTRIYFCCCTAYCRRYSDEKALLKLLKKYTNSAEKAHPDICPVTTQFIYEHIWFTPGELGDLLGLPNTSSGFIEPIIDVIVRYKEIRWTDTCLGEFRRGTFSPLFLGRQ